MARDDIRFTSGNRSNANEKYCILASEFIEKPEYFESANSSNNGGHYRMLKSSDGTIAGLLSEAPQDNTLLISEINEVDYSSGITFSSSGEAIAQEFVEGDFDEYNWRDITVMYNGSSKVSNIYINGTSYSTSSFPKAFTVKRGDLFSIPSAERYECGYAPSFHIYSTLPTSISQPSLSFSGRTLTITNNNPDAVYYYADDSSQISGTSSGTLYSGSYTTITIDSSVTTDTWIKIWFKSTRYKYTTDSYYFQVDYPERLTVGSTQQQLADLTSYASIRFTTNTILEITKTGSYLSLDQSIFELSHVNYAIVSSNSGYIRLRYKYDSSSSTYEYDDIAHFSYDDNLQNFSGTVTVTYQGTTTTLLTISGGTITGEEVLSISNTTSSLTLVSNITYNSGSGETD